jgi:NADP-dependent 3-hydroxy acid dehydrogenase YdfG
MTEKKTWFITVTGRGMGVDIAKATPVAGHNVVATGRGPDAVREAAGGLLSHADATAGVA